MLDDEAAALARLLCVGGTRREGGKDCEGPACEECLGFARRIMDAGWRRETAEPDYWLGDPEGLGDKAAEELP